MEIFVGLLTLLIWISNTKGFDLGNYLRNAKCMKLKFSILESCRSPIGIETGKILDSAFSASSHANENTVASKAR
jgi:hypothetical protein